MNTHDHIHNEGCSCGHDHAHEYEHDASCSCGHDHSACGGCGMEEAPGIVHVEHHIHDDARVISGRLTVYGTYDPVKKAVASALERIAKEVQASDGIVGHIKASCTVKTVDMFSVTDTDVTVKSAPEQEIKINLAAIVFLIDPEDAEDLVRLALETVRDRAGK